MVAHNHYDNNKLFTARYTGDYHVNRKRFSNRGNFMIRSRYRHARVSLRDTRREASPREVSRGHVTMFGDPLP